MKTVMLLMAVFLAQPSEARELVFSRMSSAVCGSVASGNASVQLAVPAGQMVKVQKISRGGTASNFYPTVFSISAGPASGPTVNLVSVARFFTVSGGYVVDGFKTITDSFEGFWLSPGDVLTCNPSAGSGTGMSLGFTFLYFSVIE